ncbi:MAG: glycosyltransferase family 4 protein [Thermodesulfobacteriota bacterium]|nr:glycosyltransferase family 4 protein [Thermodesulfobacteriota bacterium]
MSEIRLKKIGFFTEGPPFDGDTPDQRALGGSETALVQAARALAKRGHRVTVFNNCARPGVFDGVTYLHRREFVKRFMAAGFDVFIVSRFFGFFSVPIRADLKILWNHDTLDRPAALRPFLDCIDIFFALSGFHRDNFLTRIPSLADRIFVTRNGIDPVLIDQAVKGVSKDPNKIIYASRPERGLKILLDDIWPKLIQARPGLTLYLCGYKVDRLDLAPSLAELYNSIDDLVNESKNVVILGPLAKHDYYRHLAESALMLYPCVFPETSCIAALEAQACLTPILTTNGFALSETVGTPEFKVPGRPGTKAYNQEFIKRTLGLLQEPGKAAALAGKAGSDVRGHYNWPLIAAEWDRLFDLALTSRRSVAAQRLNQGTRRHEQMV